MFDLEREIKAWSEAALEGACRDAAGVAELTDHLWCEVERARSGGLSDEQAFHAAVAKLGPAKSFAAEHAKNRSLLGEACAIAARLEGGGPRGSHKELLVTHSLFWAGLMLVLAFMLPKGADRDAPGWLFVAVLIPAWWTSEQLLRRALRRPPRGGAR